MVFNSDNFYFRKLKRDGFLRGMLILVRCPHWVGIALYFHRPPGRKELVRAGREKMGNVRKIEKGKRAMEEAGRSRSRERKWTMEKFQCQGSEGMLGQEQLPSSLVLCAILTFPS